MAGVGIDVDLWVVVFDVISPLLLRKSYEAEGFMEHLDRLYDRLSKLKREPLLKRQRR